MDCRTAALSYAARGWSVIPMQPQAKCPMVAWRAFQQRRAEPGEIEAWSRRWPDANVGIVTDAVSGLVVIDVDARHGGADSVAAPPSLHPSGRHYAWLKGRAPGDLPLATLPPHFFAPADPAPGGHAPAHWRHLVGEDIEEGRRNDTLASLAGHLLWREADPEVVLELLLAWNRAHCRPALPDDEVLRTVQSIARLHERA